MAGLRLDRRITVWRAALVDDGLQSRRGEAVEIGQAWAAQSDPAASESAADMGQAAMALSCTFTLRAQGVGLSIGAADVIRCDGAEWLVVGIMPVEDRRIRRVRAVQRVAA